MGLLLRAAGRCCGLDPLARLRLKLWFKRRLEGPAAGGLARLVGRRARPPRSPFLVLLYHRLSPSGGPWRPTRALSVPVDVFQAQMEELRSRFEVVPLDRLLDPPSAAPLPLAAVTFDDGYRDNLELAHPVLKSLGLPAAVFVTTRWLGQAAPFWWYELEDLIRRGALGPRGRSGRWTAYAGELSRLKSVSEDEREARLEHLRRLAVEPVEWEWAPRLLSAEDLRGMEESSLWTVGGHTHSHRVLAGLSLESAREEIAENKRILEEVLGHPLRWFAYPNGDSRDFQAEHVDLLRRSGYAGAFTGASPWEEDGGDAFRLPRLAVSGLEGLTGFRKRLSAAFPARR